MKAVLVASNKAHARAIMLWSRYSDAQWDVVFYGDVIHQTYSVAVLARPAGDITPDHALWVSHILRPKVVGRVSTVPGWSLEVTRPIEIEDMRDEGPARMRS